MSESPSTPLSPSSKDTNPTGTAETSKVFDQGDIKVVNETDIAPDEDELSQRVMGITLESSEGQSHHPRWQTSSIVRPRDTSLQIPSTMDVAFTQEDWDEVHRVFPDATIILYSYPFCVICGVTPPNEPVSVKGLITEFYDNIEEYSYLPCDCGNPLIPDPLEKRFERSKHLPAFDELDARMDELEHKVGIPLRTMALYHHVVVIEVDEEFLDLDKLPGKVGGRIACWGAYGKVWKWQLHAPRRKGPQIVGEDDLDYKLDLGSGSKICGEIGEGSAGVLMKDTRTGEEVITVPAHIFDTHDDAIVFHTDLNPSNRIGELNKLDRVTDWGFCILDKDVSFSNKSNFIATVPTHFVTSTDVKNHCTQYSYFAADGDTAGIVWMTLAGVHTERNRRAHRLTPIHSYLLRKARGSFGEATHTPAAGLCGAPVVHQEDLDDAIVTNGVIGFFHKSNLLISQVVAVDELMNEGWEVV